MKTRLEMLTEIREATFENQILLEVEIEHGTRMMEAIKGGEHTGKLRYQISQELKRKDFDKSNKKIAIEILDDMIAEENGDKPKPEPKEIEDVSFPEEKPKDIIEALGESQEAGEKAQE